MGIDENSYFSSEGMNTLIEQPYFRPGASIPVRTNICGVLCGGVAFIPHHLQCSPKACIDCLSNKLVIYLARKLAHQICVALLVQFKVFNRIILSIK